MAKLLKSNIFNNSESVAKSLVGIVKSSISSISDHASFLRKLSKTNLTINGVSELNLTEKQENSIDRDKVELLKLIKSLNENMFNEMSKINSNLVSFNLSSLKALSPSITTPQTPKLFDPYGVEVQKSRPQLSEDESEQDCSCFVSLIKLTKRMLKELVTLNTGLLGVSEKISGTNTVLRRQYDKDKSEKESGLQEIRNSKELFAKYTKNLEKLGDSVMKLVGSLSSELGSIGKELKDPFLSGITKIGGGILSGVFKYVAYKSLLKPFLAGVSQIGNKGLNVLLPSGVIVDTAKGTAKSASGSVLKGAELTKALKEAKSITGIANALTGIKESTGILGKFGSVFKAVSKTKIGKGVPLLSGAITAGMELFESGNISKAVTRGTGSGVGSGIGMLAGGVLGSFVGPIGTVVGGTIGSIAGDYIGDKLATLFYDNRESIFSFFKDIFPNQLLSSIMKWLTAFKDWIFDGAKTLAEMLWDWWGRKESPEPKIAKELHRPAAISDEQREILAKVFDNNIDLINKLQDIIISESSNKSQISKENSMAAGYYQIIPKTVVGLAKKMNMTDFDNMSYDTPEGKMAIAKKLAAMTFEEQTKLYKQYLSDLLEIKPNPSVIDLKAYGFKPLEYLESLRKHDTSVIAVDSSKIKGLEEFKQNPMFRKWDSNGDGKLTVQEMIDGIQTMPEFSKLSEPSLTTPTPKPKPEKLETPRIELQENLGTITPMKAPILVSRKDSAEWAAVANMNALEKSRVQSTPIMITPIINNNIVNGNFGGQRNTPDTFGPISPVRAHEPTFEKAIWTNSQLSLLRLA